MKVNVDSQQDQKSTEHTTRTTRATITETNRKGSSLYRAIYEASHPGVPDSTYSTAQVDSKLHPVHLARLQIKSRKSNTFFKTHFSFFKTIARFSTYYFLFSFFQFFISSQNISNIRKYSQTTFSNKIPLNNYFPYFPQFPQISKVSKIPKYSKFVSIYS